MKRLIAFLSLAIFMQACTNSDTTAPVINVLSLSPTEGQAMVCGEMQSHVVIINSTGALSGQFRVTDDVALSQYKIDLHNNFDCHGHTSGKVETTDWYVIDVVDLVGSEQVVDFNLPVPADVTTGNYHFHIDATDESGNSAETEIYSLKVTNASDTEAPVLTVSTPVNTSFSVQKGDAIQFEGAITDNLALGGGSNGKMELRYWEENNQTINELYTEEFENSAGTTVNFDFEATVPVTVADGTYIFELRAFDAINNPSNTVQFTVQID